MVKRYIAGASYEWKDGVFVLHSDYEILERKLAELVEAVKWERECRETHVACVYAGLPHLYNVHGSHYTDAVLMDFGRIRDAARAAVDALVENSGHEMRKTAQPSLTHAFLQGAKFWEFHQTSGTMWQSDQRLCAARAKEMEADGALGVDALVGEG